MAKAHFTPIAAIKCFFYGYCNCRKCTQHIYDRGLQFTRLTLLIAPFLPVKVSKNCKSAQIATKYSSFTHQHTYKHTLKLTFSSLFMVFFSLWVCVRTFIRFLLLMLVLLRLPYFNRVLPSNIYMKHK